MGTGMSRFTITRTPAQMPDEVERGAIRKFLFECFKGANDADVVNDDE